MDITLDYSTLYDIVSRSLSVIGKRARNEEGGREYENVTLGTNEKEIITDYLRQAIIDLSAELSAFITANTDNAITFKLELPSSHNAGLDPFIQKSCEAYCTSFALHAWLFVTVPRLAPRYLEDCKRQLAAVIRLIHDKKAPDKPASSPLDVEATVE